MSASPQRFFGVASIQGFLQIWILLLFQRVNADFIFHNPPNTVTGGQHFLPGWAVDNPVFQIGTEFNATWTTDWTAYTIFLSQLVLEGISGYQGSEANIVEFTKSSITAETGGFNFNVEIGSFDITTSNIFFFTAVDAASTNTVTYGIFNVTENAVTTGSKSPSAATITTTPTSSPTSSTTSASAQSTTATESSTTAADEAKSTGTSAVNKSNQPTKPGLGIGLGVGLLLITVVAAALVFKIFKDKKKNEVPLDDRCFGLIPPPSSSDIRKTELKDYYSVQDRELPATPVAVHTMKPRNYELPG